MNEEKNSSAVSQLPKPLVRRITRVRARAGDDNYPDETLDDVFVLWRALESTFSHDGSERARSEEAIAGAIAYALRFGALTAVAPATLAWCDSLRLLHRLSTRSLGAWFNKSELTTVEAQDLLRRAAAITNAAKAPERWRDQDSRNVAWAMYSLRCAVFHASLDTEDNTAARITSAFRRALIEVGVLRGAMLAGKSVEEAHSQFDAALNELIANA